MIEKQNKVPTKPQLADVLNLWKQDIFQNLNCHAIAEIQEFDDAKLTVKASIVYQKTFFSSDPAIPPKFVDYPILIDCPVVILSGGTCGVTFPITAGDVALILFNDRDIDNWVTSGQTAPPDTLRMHSMSDAVALIGLRSALKPIVPYDTLRANLFNGTTGVGVNTAQVKIYNAVTTLGIQLANLMTQLTVLNTALTTLATPFAALPPDSTPVLNSVIQPPFATFQGSIVPIQASISIITAQLAGLLE